MPLTIDVPEDVQRGLQPRWDELSVQIRENLAMEGYRQGLLGLAQVRRLLGLATRWDAQVFLGERGVEVFDYDPAELDRELELHRRLAAREAQRSE